MPDPTPAVPKATPPKQEFVDKYPYLVYTSQNTVVYSNSLETSIDDIGGELETATVTIDNQTDSSAYAYVSNIVTTDDGTVLDFEAEIAASQKTVLTVPVMESTKLSIDMQAVFTVSGDIESAGSGNFIITGDGTVTCAGE